MMDNIFHFTNPNVKPLKKKNLSLIPTAFINTSFEKNQSDMDSGNQSPLIYQKKSHFNDIGKEKLIEPIKCAMNLSNQAEENLIENDSMDTTPLSPAKMEHNISEASKKLQTRFDKKSKTTIINSMMADINHSQTMQTISKINVNFEEKEQKKNNNIDLENEAINLYEKQISLKKFTDATSENIEEQDNEECVKGLQAKLEKMNDGIPSATKQLKMVKFAEQVNSVEVNSSDHIKHKEKKYQIENFINNHPFRHLIFAPFCTESTFKKHLTLTYRGLIYARKCLKGPSESFIKSKQVSLIESKVPRYKTLLLDLDETLIHTCSLKENPEHIVKTMDSNGNENTIGVNIRPFCIEFLERLCKYYEIFIFTASSNNYANTIVNFIDPDNKYINGILTRQNCMETKNGFFVKDLRIIKNRELKNMILVDNLAHSFGFQINNGIPILEWHNNKKKDMELKYLLDYLLEILYADDVREFNKKRLRLHEFSIMRPDELFS